MKSFTFFVDGKPATKGSWRAIRRRGGGTYMKPDNDNERPWASAVAWTARKAGLRPVRVPVHVDIEFSFARPKKPANPYPRGDVDKLVRSCLDALTGIAWVDDSQVICVTARKAYAEVGQALGAKIWIGEAEAST